MKEGSKVARAGRHQPHGGQEGGEESAGGLTREGGESMWDVGLGSSQK